MKSMKTKPFQPASKMSMMLMLAYLMNVATATKDYDDDFSNDQIKVDHRGDAFITAIAAWSVMVVTLEVNDFRHHLAAAYDSLPSPSDTSTNRYIASLVAIRYGCAHALLDWFIMYSIGYVIVAGLTWNNAEPESVVVIQGFSVIFSAAIFAVASFKFPQWLGVYRKAKLVGLKDTSDLAPQAVQDLAAEGSTLKSFRYQVRLGVGKHFSQWVYFLLPFYVDLKIWWNLLSILAGWVFGYVVLFVVFKCRQRFRKHKLLVAIGAGIFLAFVSALVFTRGMYIVEEGWQRDLGDNDLVMSLSFILWSVACLLVQGWKYIEHRYLVVEDDIEGGPTMFEDETVKNNANNNLAREAETSIDDDGDILREPSELEEPLLDRGLSSTHDSPYFESVYFNRIKFQSVTESDMSNDERTPHEIYMDVSTMEEANGDVKWYQQIWLFLPFQPAWKLFVMGTLTTFRCCRKDSDFKTYSCCHKLWFALSRILKIGINGLALYVAIIACGATIQRSITISRLPHSFEATYKYQNVGPVCAYDSKCGELRSFESADLAVLNNFTVAHCGACAACSNWHDFPFQLLDLATPSRTCGQKNFMAKGEEFLKRVQKCIEDDIGFTAECSWEWANNVACSKKNCAFIYMQSLMTNQVANFKVGPKTITSATCSESACEAGPDYHFVKGVGANRRRMDIQSEIRRPPKEQCQIVGIPENSNGDADWKSFLNVSYNKKMNKVSPLPACNE